MKIKNGTDLLISLVKGEKEIEFEDFFFNSNKEAITDTLLVSAEI